MDDNVTIKLHLPRDLLMKGSTPYKICNVKSRVVIFTHDIFAQEILSNFLNEPQRVSFISKGS